MKDIVTVSNLVYKIENKILFDSLDLTIKEGTWNSIIGPNGSGKSTLAKILSGIIITDSSVRINDLLIDNKNVSIVKKYIEYSKYSIPLTFKTPYELLFSKKDNDQDIIELCKRFGIENILDKSLEDLDRSNICVINIMSSIINNPKVLVIDNTLSYILPKEKSKIINILKEMGITVINFTDDAEELIYSDNIILLNDGKIILNDNRDEVLKKEKLFNSLGLELPFMVSLSLKLMSYKLINKIILDMNEMIGVLWK